MQIWNSAEKYMLIAHSFDKKNISQMTMQEQILSTLYLSIYQQIAMYGVTLWLTNRLPKEDEALNSV